MSCNSWMGCTVTVLDGKYDDAAREWAGRYRSVYEEDGRLNVEIIWDSAGWFDGAVEDLKKELSDLPMPLDAWKAEVRYEFYDEPSSDGSFTEFSIEDGRLTNCKESRIEMVDIDPWFKFDMREEA